ncbi:TatD family hydrolase [Niallia taxi]|uniref:amidohydrolase family protein n=1 Tax=Niallia taxi TaxID=2499688 RepID=UPI00124903C4|nr:TatD family hydrolase [Niallia taxi]MDK8639919.1 TatD family hydrolase [Niallia taxi]MED4055301.1 TatD family hydrolase [Niallia taxi]MED4117492.1 TatD family hydrolase [Niallia taxi]
MKKIIDAHIHLSNIQSFKETAQLLSKVDYSLAGVQAEMEAANIVLAIGMGVTETPKMGFPDYEANTPMGLDLGDTLPRTIVYCAGINPYKLGTAAIAELEREIQKDNVVGIKIYLGYYPFYAYDQVYDPVYELAEKYDLPVVFHTGDTYSERGLLKYSHPLAIDEVAVKYRKIRFMMAHFGDPWTLTGAEILYKNRNVYADLSGLVVGARKELEQAQQGIFLQHLRHALVYSNSYDKLLFGTDWPLAPFGPYIEFIQNLIPEMYHEDVFYNTALKVFPKIKKFL